MSGPGVVEAWILIPHVEGMTATIGVFFNQEGITVPSGPGGTSQRDANGQPMESPCLVVRISCSINLDGMRMSLSTSIIPAETEREA